MFKREHGKKCCETSLLIVDFLFIDVGDDKEKKDEEKKEGKEGETKKEIKDIKGEKSEEKKDDKVNCIAIQ